MSTIEVPRREYEGWVDENADQEWRLVCLSGESRLGRFGQLLGRPSRPQLHPDERLSCPLVEGELYAHPHVISGERLGEGEIAWVEAVTLWAGDKQLREWPHPGVWIAQGDAISYVINVQLR
jgi:hypothetical protein